MRDKKVTFLVQAAAIAAVYVVLTLIFHPFSYGEIQVRISEALTILPFFTPAAIPGLFVGCIIANIMGGCILPDIIFGSVATLLGAVGSYLIAKGAGKFRIPAKFLVPIPPIAANTIIVPLVLRFGYLIDLPIPLMMLTVGIGEVISCGILGLILLTALTPHAEKIFVSP